MGKKASSARRNFKVVNGVSAPVVCQVKETVSFKDAEESEYRDIMDTPHCNNETCHKDRLREKVTCECGFVHYCSNGCKEEDMESHKHMCKSMRSGQASKKGNIVMKFMRMDGGVFDTTLVVFNGHVCKEDGVMYGNCKFVYDSPPQMGRILEYSGPLQYRTFKRNGSKEKGIMAQGTGKSIIKSDPRAHVKTKLHIGGYKNSLRHGRGRMYKDLEHEYWGSFENGSTIMLESDDQVVLNLPNLGKNQRCLSNMSYNDTHDLFDRACMNLKKIIVFHVKDGCDILNGVYETKPKVFLKGLDGVRFTRGFDVSGNFEVEYMISKNNTGDTYIIPFIKIDGRRFPYTCMHSKIPLAFFLAGEESVAEECEIDTRNVVGSRCVSEEDNPSETSSSDDGCSVQGSDTSSSSEDECTAPVVRSEKRKHRRIIDVSSVDEKHDSLFKNKELSTRDMSVDIKKESSVKDMLSANNWVKCRQKSHLVFKRNVLIDGDIVTQKFVMSATPSDKRARKSQLKDLVNLNRGVDKVFLTNDK